MSKVGSQYVYGPVPSRRLGRSLGVDLVPFKTCTYDCVYCQLGRTTNKTTERKQYVATKKILAELEQRLAAGDNPDYITISGSGEPTLNSGIGDLIGKIKGLTDIPVAVITNGSLLWMREVQDALMAADLILPSLDAGDEHLFRYVNRPHRSIGFNLMVDGIAAFTKRFQGEVWLEVLLLGGVTGIPAEVEKIASIVGRIGPARVQLNTVSRPPAEEFALPVDLDQLERFLRFFPGPVEVISEKKLGKSQPAQAPTATEADILALLRRRPCTFVDVASGLGIHEMEALKHLDALVKAGTVTKVLTDGRTFYAAVGLMEVTRL
jgi:wyosine [tRNA(Phe)-imidazoG37] synthetase (radical SAM superfamily)